MTRMIACFFVVLVLASCHNYYKVATFRQLAATETARQLDSLRLANRYLVLRNGTGAAYHISKVEPGSDAALVVLDSLPVAHRYYAFLGSTAGQRYQRKDPAQGAMVNEAHLYIPYDPSVKEGSYRLPYANVEKVDVLQHDAKRSTNSHVLGGLGIVSGTLLATLLVVLAVLPSD